MVIRRKHGGILGGVMALILALVMPLAIMSPAKADDLSFEINVDTSLTLELSDMSVDLELDPGGADGFAEQYVDITVGTNNVTGYSIAMEAESTALTRTAAYFDGTNIVTPQIATLESVVGGSEAFPANRWGYKLAGGDYRPFVSNEVFFSEGTTTNNTTTRVTFGAKIDYAQPSGEYSLALGVVALAAPTPPEYMQDFTLADCANFARDNDVIVWDARDGNDYTVRYIEGSDNTNLCWMTQNLRIGPGEVLDFTNSNVPEYEDDATTPFAFTIPVDSATGFNSYTAPMVHAPTDPDISTINSNSTVASAVTAGTISEVTKKDVGMWYNYCAATAGTICDSDSSGTTDAAVWDICPKGWRLFTSTERSRSMSGAWATGGEDATNANKFRPVAGGYFYNSSVYNPANGYWWSSTAYSAADRRTLYFYLGNTSLDSSYYYRSDGRYIRCVRAS